MTVDFGELDAVVDRAGRPHDTLHFERGGESVHLYVCVDKGYSPVSMALVHPPTTCVQYREVPRDGDECRRLVTDLHGMLCRLAARGRALTRRPGVVSDHQSGQAGPPAAAGNKPPSAGLVLPLLPNEGWRLVRTGSVSR
jgi:hypothetical protein